MDFSLREALSILCPEYTIEDKKKTKIAPLNKFKFREWIDCYNVDAIISCICSQMKEMFSLQKEKNNILDIFEKYELIDSLNTAKILKTLESGVISVDFILFLSCYYECNIYIFHENSKIVKVFSPMEKINSSQLSVLIFHTLDDNYKMLEEPIDITHDIIIDMFPGILFIAIGLEYGKHLLIGDCEPVNYIKGLKQVETLTDHLNGITLTEETEHLRPILSTMSHRDVCTYIKTVINNCKKIKFVRKTL